MMKIKINFSGKFKDCLKKEILLNQQKITYINNSILKMTNKKIVKNKIINL